MAPPAPLAPLSDLVAAIRHDETLLTERLREPSTAVAPLGALAAAGPRAQGAEADYAFVFEAVREGYLLHYGEPRVLEELDQGLALLAGDHVYALGLERVAALGDLEAVRELADLISLSALIHADGAGDGETAKALWLAAASAVGSGTSEAYEAAKARLRSGGAGRDCARALAESGRVIAATSGMETAWGEAADSIDFDADSLSARG